MPTHRQCLGLAILFTIVAATNGCTRARAVDMVATVTTFRAAIDSGAHDIARQYLNDDPRTWYGARDGAGSPLVIGGGRWKAWDDEFNGTSELGEWHVDGNTVFAVGIESNDYYRLIERAPSSWLLTYFFDDGGRIAGRMISSVPDHLRSSEAPRPDRGEAFDAWLRATYPDEYDYLRPNGEIDPTEDRAARTRAKLIEWREAVGLPAID